jgi:FkbM family methyltransferase
MDALIVKRGIDINWLKQQARDEHTLDLLTEVEQMMADLEKGVVSASREIVVLNLGKNRVAFRRCEMVRSLKVYTEIFKENLHGLVHGFDNAGAQTVIDLGANAGFYTMKIKQDNPQAKVIAVEPNPDVFELLQMNIELNNLSDIITVNKAVCCDSEEIIFKTVDQASVLGGKYLGELNKSKFPWLKEEMIKSFKVKCICLSSLLVDNAINQVDILKLDVQDMELEIIESSLAVLNKVKRIVIEPHRDETKDKLVKLLSNNGFELIYHESREFGDLYFVNKELL